MDVLTKITFISSSIINFLFKILFMFPLISTFAKKLLVL